MAEGSVSLAQDQFNCFICQDLLKDPVFIPCGHSYCMSCITGCWDQDDQKGVYSCPQCRQISTPRPVLGKNTMLAEVMEKLKKTKLQAAGPADCYTGSGDVECDVCTETKHKAVKSCLVCLNSYCQNHLEQHENLFKGKRHNLMDGTGRLQKMICPQHDKLLEIYCCTDQQCICYPCMMDEHKNHETVFVEAEWTKKQRELKKKQNIICLRVQKKQKMVQKVIEALKSYKRSAQAAVEDSEKFLPLDLERTLLIIERSHSKLTQLIRDQEKAAVSEAEGLMERLEQEIADLWRRHAELEQLSHTEDHIYFFKSFQSLFVPPRSIDLSSITVSSLLSFDDVAKSVSHLKEKLEYFCKEEIEKIYGKVTYIEIICTSELQTRQEFLQYFCQFTLDPNTVNKKLRLSEGNRVITYSDTVQQYPDHPDRFEYFWQVLCRESVCGRCYWEVELSGDCVDISVSYKSISRKGRGKECRFGCNDQSWSLDCSESSCLFLNNKKYTELSVPCPSRIGVYVDHSAGTLSFYEVSDTMTLIHRVQTTFTQPLYPGFELCIGSTVKLFDFTK